VKLLGIFNLGDFRDGRQLRRNVYKLFLRCEAVGEPKQITG
jgi:hypothetical protein